jgi:hypothetical protein
LIDERQDETCARFGGRIRACKIYATTLKDAIRKILSLTFLLVRGGFSFSDLAIRTKDFEFAYFWISEVS